MMTKKQIRIMAHTAIFLLCSVITQASELQQLVQQNPQEAIKQLNSLITKDANNQNAYFLKAVALENAGQTNNAITAYQEVIKRFPENPEPYVNLARLYIAQGNLTQAKTILANSFDQNEAYAAAYQGLQQINAHLAAKVYQQALNKQTSIDQPVIKRFTALALPEESLTSEVAVVATKKETVSTPVATNVPASNSPTNQSVQSIETPESPKTTPELKVNVLGWAKAWSDQNVIKFVGYYADNYSVPGKTRAQWLYDRRIKITNKEFIKVNVGAFQQKQLGDDEIQVDFVQSYRSDTIVDTIRKRLTFKKFGAKWKIIDERVIQ